MPAQKKTNAQKKTAAARTAPKNTQKTAPKKAAPKSAPKPQPKAAVQEKAELRQRPDPDSLLHQFIPCIFVVAAIVFCVFLAVSSNEAAGKVGGFIRMCSYGLFGWGAWLIPVLLVVCALMWKKTITEGSIGSLFGFSFASLTVISAMLHAIASKSALVFNPAALFAGVDGKMAVGGAVGGFLANILISSIQKTATYILLIFAAIILVMFTLRLTPRSIMLYFRYRRAIARERAAERAEQMEAEYARRAEEYERRGGISVDPAPETKKQKKQNCGLF